MRIAVVDWDVPYPANSGKRLRTLNLILQLADRHEISYFSRAAQGNEEAREATRYLNERNVQIIFADDPVPAKKGPLFYSRVIANALGSPLPYAVAVHRSARFRQLLAAHAEKERFDLWQLEWSAYVDSVRHVPGAKTVLMAHNVDSLIWDRYASTDSRPMMRAYLRRQARRFDRFERRAFGDVTRVVAVSDDDARLMQTRFGVSHPDVVDNGVDLDYFHCRCGPRDAREMLFVGSLDWRPNLDGLGWWLDEVMPLILAREPSAKLTVVGRNPPPAFVERLKSTSYCELHGSVPDVRPYIARAGMMVVPLRIGGGSRLKIIEAAASGLPVISTRIGAEGLKFREGVDLILADAPATLADAALHWARHPDQSRQFADSARKIAVEHYSWRALASKLEAVWERAASAP